MIEDALAKNIFTKGKDPALILRIKSGKIFISEANSSFLKFIDFAEKKILGLELFSVIALSNTDEVAKLETSISQLVDENGENYLSLSNYCAKGYFDTNFSQHVNVHNVLLSSDEKAGKYILHTVVPKPVQNSDVISKHFYNRGIGKSSENSKSILEAISEGAEEPFILLDNQLRITFFSDNFKSLYQEYYGGTIEIGCSIIEYAKEERRPLLTDLYNRVLSGKQEQSEIIAEVSPNVFKKLILDFKPIMGSSGTVERIFISAKDITLQHEAQHKLEENERELNFIYNNLQDAVFVIGVGTGPSFTFISANQAFFKFAELPAKAVLGASINQVIPHAHLKKSIDHYLKCIAGRTSLSREEILRSQSGEKTTITTITPVFDSSGSCKKLIGSIHDITDHKNLEKISELTNRKLSKILESSPDVICTLNEDGLFLSVNAASSRMWSYQPEQLIGKCLTELLHIEDREAMKKALGLIVKKNEINHFENRLRRADGTYLPLIWSARWDAQERIIYGVAKDGTEKQIAENNVKISEQRFKTLVQDGSDLIAILDLEGKYKYVSPTSATILGTAPSEYLGKNAFDFIHPADKSTAIKGFCKLATERRVELAPFRFCHKDGSWRWIETVITDLTDDSSVNGIVANSRDITEKLNAQRDILLSNERYRLVSKATFDAVWDWDLETNKIYWGDGFQRIFNFSPDQLCSNIDAWSNLIHPDDVARVEKKLYALLESAENQWSDEYRFAKSDQEFVVVADRGLVVRDDKGKAVRVVGALQDVSKQRASEYQLKLLESVVTQTSDLIMITEAEPISKEERRIIYVNEAFCSLTGYTPKELIGKTPRLLHGENTNRKELERLRKSLRLFRSCEVSTINYKKNGEEFWNNFVVNPVANEQGLFTHCVSIGRDITNLVNLQKQERLISSVSRIFNKTGGLVAAMEKTMQLIIKSGRYLYAEIWMADHDRLYLSLLGSHAIDLEQEEIFRNIDSIKRVKKSEGFSGTVWESGKIQTKVVANAPQYTLLGLPLCYNKELIGVLIVGSKNRNAQFESGILSEKFGDHLGAEMRRKQLEEELEQIFDFAPDIILISDLKGHIKKINPAASVLLGFTNEELMAKPFTEFLHPDDRKEAIKRIEQKGEGDPTEIVEYRYITKSGEIKWLAWTSHVILERGLVFSVGKDITEKQNLEELLGRSSSLAKVGSWEINVLKGTVYWSDVTKEIREAAPDFEPDLDTGINNFRSDVDKLTIRRKVEDCIASGVSWDEELEILTFKGNAKWIRTIGQAEMVDGRCVRIFGSFQDIDVRKKAEIEAKVALKELEDSEKRYSDLFHLSPNPKLVFKNDTFQFIDVNEAALNHYGYSYNEFMAMTLKDIRPDIDIPAFKNTIAGTKGRPFFQGLFKHQKKNGEIIDVEIKSNIVNFKGEEATLSLVNDVTERQKYFTALEKQNELLREISWVQSHVVRAPLAKLMGLVNLLGKHSMQEVEKQQMLVNKIECCTTELDEIIREITKKAEQQEKLRRQ